VADVQPKPDGYPTLTPYLAVAGAKEAIRWYEEHLGAKARGGTMEMPDGMVGHAELQIGDSVVMLSDEMPDWGNAGPKTIGGTPVTLVLYVDDVDTSYEKAVAGGATAVRPVETHFYGDRAGLIEDPWGHRWNLMTHVEDVSPDEMERRMAAQFGG